MYNIFNHTLTHDIMPKSKHAQICIVKNQEVDRWKRSVVMPKDLHLYLERDTMLGSFEHKAQ